MPRVTSLALLVLALAALVISLPATAAAAASTLVLRPGEARTFSHAVRGDIVACGALHLTVQRTPMIVHIQGMTIPRFLSRSVYGASLSLTMSSPRPQVVKATCTRR
jgi:hypothetical protein